MSAASPLASSLLESSVVMVHVQGQKLPEGETWLPQARVLLGLPRFPSEH